MLIIKFAPGPWRPVFLKLHIMWLVPTKPAGSRAVSLAKMLPSCVISLIICEVTNFPAAILSLYQEKAFDRVDWSFVFSTLSKMGFRDSFIKWIRLLYRNPRCSVMVNGHISPFFFPSRGVRQGCPLSPLLYVLSMEVLACNVRASPVIQGVTLPGLSTPLPVLSLYADDVSVIVSSDGATEDVFYTYAGTFIGNGNLEEANWCPRVDAVAKCVSAWSSRNLSYGRRAQISKTLALTRVWYMATMLPIPGWALGKLNRIIFPFFGRAKKTWLPVPWSSSLEVVAASALFPLT